LVRVDYFDSDSFFENEVESDAERKLMAFTSSHDSPNEKALLSERLLLVRSSPLPVHCTTAAPDDKPAY